MLTLCIYTLESFFLIKKRQNFPVQNVVHGIFILLLKSYLYIDKIESKFFLLKKERIYSIGQSAREYFEGGDSG